MNEIKRCPFCAGEAVLKETQYIDGGHVENVAWVECSKCGAKGSLVHECMRAEDIRREAETMWNMRDGRTCRMEPCGRGIFKCDACLSIYLIGTDDPSVPRYCPGCGAVVTGYDE